MLGIPAASISKQRWGPWALSPLPRNPGWSPAAPSCACPGRGQGSGRSPQVLAAALNLGTAAAMAPVTHQQGQPERGPQHLWHKPACCSCYLCSWVTCTAFWVQMRTGSAWIIVGNKQAWAQLKSRSIGLPVTLHRSPNAWCNKADGQNKFDLGQREIRRKHGISPLEQVTANLLWYHLLKIVLGVVTYFQIFHLSQVPTPFFCSKICFPSGCRFKTSQNLLGMFFVKCQVVK